MPTLTALLEHFPSEEVLQVCLSETRESWANGYFYLGGHIKLKPDDDITDAQIPLPGPNSIVGRAVVVHELADDLGKGDNSETGTQGKTSKTTGNAGGRFACGVIGLAPEDASL